MSDSTPQAMRSSLCKDTQITIWYDVAQSDPTQVVAQTQYDSGPTPESWTLTYYLFPGFVWASETHPVTPFLYSEVASPPEPPPAETICIHQVTQLPGTLWQMPTVDEVSKGWYDLMVASARVGYVHVAETGPESQVETWYIDGPYTPLGPGASSLDETIVWRANPPQTIDPHTIYHHDVTILPQGKND